MGCDIHICTERLRTVNSEKQWVNTDYWAVNPYYDPSSEDEWETEFDIHQFYKGRWYELFGQLAGVRSDTKPIISPKGFPSDASKQVSELYKMWDAHTTSYLTIGELNTLKIAYGETVKRDGMISQKQSDELDSGIKPTSWCGWTSDKSCVHREWEDEASPVSELLDQLDKFLKSRFYEYEIENMDDSEFRVVFWFDN